MKAGLIEPRMLRGLLEAAERRTPMEPVELVKAALLEPGVPRGVLEPVVSVGPLELVRMVGSVEPMEPAELAWIGSMMPACLLLNDSLVCFTGLDQRIQRTRRSRPAIDVMCKVRTF